MAIIAAMAIELTDQTSTQSVAEENEAFDLTNAQKRELDRRLELAKKDSKRGRTWDEIKAEFMNSR